MRHGASSEPSFCMLPKPNARDHDVQPQHAQQGALAILPEYQDRPHCPSGARADSRGRGRAGCPFQ
jgi:hypothetical protein